MNRFQAFVGGKVQRTDTCSNTDQFGKFRISAEIQFGDLRKIRTSQTFQSCKIGQI